MKLKHGLFDDDEDDDDELVSVENIVIHTHHEIGGL